MNILEKWNKAFTLEAYESPTSKEAIQKLQKFSSIDVPLDYLEVIQQCTNAEINVKMKFTYVFWALLIA